jgi:hypothetical protein
MLQVFHGKIKIFITYNLDVSAHDLNGIWKTGHLVPGKSLTIWILGMPKIQMVTVLTLALCT